jgi:trigger factor
MKTTVDKTDDLHRNIQIELPWDMISQELDQEYRQLAKKVTIKGFRQGKVPRKVLKQRFGERVQADVLGRLIQEAYEAALIQNRITPVAKPEVERGDFAEGQPYNFSAKVEVQPDIELAKLDGFDVSMETVEVTEEMQAEELEKLRVSRTVLMPLEGRDVAEMGDMAILDYKASQVGTPLQGGEKTDHELELGSGSTVPGFEDGIVGMKVGEHKDFDLTFPKEDFPEGVAGKLVHFDVDLKALKFKEIPDLDDEFAKDLGEEGVETLADVKAMVDRRLLEGLESKAGREVRNKLIDQLIDANPFPVPPSLVERQKANMLREVQTMLQWQGLPQEQIMASTDKMIEDIAPRAEREVASALLLNAIADKEKFQVDEEEIEAHLETVAEKSGQNMAQLKALYNDPKRIEELKLNLLRDKVVDHLMKLSNMEASDGEPAAAVDKESAPAAKTPKED